MKFQLKKWTVLFLAVIMSLALTQIGASAMITPRVAVQISMSTDVDNLYQIRTNKEVTVNVTWKSVLASAGEPITIKVTNGAEILVYDKSDVTFMANGVAASIKPVTRSADGDVVTFVSGSPASSPLENNITFKVKAPSTPGDFKLSVKIGSETMPNNPLTNFVEREFTVSPLVVDTSVDVVDGFDSFDVFGEVDHEDAFIIAMEIHNKETGDVAFESLTMDISNDGNYSLGSFSFDDSHAIGAYVIDVVLLDSSFNPVATAKKEIERIMSAPLDISIKYLVLDPEESLLRYTEQYRYGEVASFSPKVFFSAYRLTGIMLNGELIEGRNLEMTITESAEVVFLYERLYSPGIICVRASDGQQFGGSSSSGGNPLGTVVTITAPVMSGHGNVVGVLVDGERATLINGNQVEVTTTKSMVITFEYQY